MMVELKSIYDRINLQCPGPVIHHAPVVLDLWSAPLGLASQYLKRLLAVEMVKVRHSPASMAGKKQQKQKTVPALMTHVCCN